jgi:hypothetical protein
LNTESFMTTTEDDGNLGLETDRYMWLG